MGCKPSTQQPPSKQRIEADEITCDAMADKLPEPAPPAPTDPRCPLDARQVFKLKKSWKGIKRCMESTGIELFVRYVVRCS